jgi:GH18 family chitinase
MAAYPNPVAATYYPIYNSGIGQYVVPTLDMPFDKVSMIFIAFGHTYPHKQGALFTFEDTQPDEKNRLPLLVKIARQVNPKISLLISLGWGHNDWEYINNDYEHNANIFVPSVIDFIREHHLDGFDIDDEAVDGYISQENFDAVIKNLRAALDEASKQDNKPYYLTITPAAGVGNVDVNNMKYFDLINTQNYGGSFPSDFMALGYPAKQITQGLDTDGCSTTLPPSQGFAGLFSWNMTSDISCNYYYTYKIAEVVGAYK